MTMDDFKLGMRVRLARRLDFFNVGTFPEGAEGTVTEIDTVQHYRAVKLDQHFDELDEWDNCLLVYENDSECSPDYWEPLVGFV